MKINGTEYTIGADPEIFMGKDGKFVNAYGIIPGSKVQPFFVEKGAVQVDGMALEFNIQPAKNKKEFVSHLDIVQEQLKAMLPKNFDFLKEATVLFDEKFLEEAPQESKILGCEADWNAYTMDVNPKPDQKALMRTVGGHVHIGGFQTLFPNNEDHMIKCGRLTRILDETLGIYSLLWDDDKQRRTMYGQAGSFRPKIYGMEYRPLSNKWLFNRKIVEFVFDSTMEAVQKFLEKDYRPHPECRMIMNNGLFDHPLLSETHNPKVERLKNILK